VEDIGYAHIDHHRSLRKGFPEVIYGENKTAVQIIGIMEKMIPRENIILVTRIDEKKAKQVQTALPDAVYHVDARMLVWAGGDIPITGKGIILVISAGTSDIPVAREAFSNGPGHGECGQKHFRRGRGRHPSPVCLQG
jgi:pyridinium-3,5-biscarboxylic acid mononucleotide synthase